MSSIDPICLRKRRQYLGFRYQRGSEIRAGAMKISGAEWREIIEREALRLERCKGDEGCLHAIGKRADGRSAELRYEIYQAEEEPQQIDALKEGA